MPYQGCHEYQTSAAVKWVFIAELYNLQRPHQGIGGLVPADRFFSAAPEVLKTLNERVAAKPLELGLPTLRAEFPRIPRCELRDPQAAYRQHFRMTHRQSTEEWT